MEFDSGIEIAEELDSDGELGIDYYNDNVVYLNIKELQYIIREAPKMIDDYKNKEFYELEVNPDLCGTCQHINRTVEESGVEYNCRAGSYTECGRMI